MIGARDDAVYDELDGRRHVGRDAIRAAFEPQHRGDFGRIRFEASRAVCSRDRRPPSRSAADAQIAGRTPQDWRLTRVRQ